VPVLLLEDEPPVELGAELEDEPLGDEDELLELGEVDVLLSVEVELELEPDVDGAVADGGVDGTVLGEAEGVVRSAGFSPTRSVRVSLQAVSRPRLSATAKTAVRNLFISMPPPCGVARPIGEVATAMPLPRGLTGRGTTFTNAAGPRKQRRCAMKLEGTYEVPAPRKKVWAAFQDPKVLKKAIPGCEKLEAVGPDEYKATMKVGVGGVKGTFEGKVTLSDKQPPDSYKMAVEGSGGPGFIRGATIITLTDQDGGGTRVSYTADLQVGGLIASVGQRMLGGVSKMMADKFFNRMGELLED